MTPLFGGLAVAIALVAIAGMQLAQVEARASRRDWERTKDHYAAEGVANIAAWRIMHAAGTPTLAWQEVSSVGALEVLAEPETLKLSLGEVTGVRGARRLRLLMGDDESKAVAAGLINLAAINGQPPSRDQILKVSPDVRWRACGLSLVSTFSGLTDNALEAPSGIQAEPLNLRPGETWRISVSRNGRGLLDEVVRFTGLTSRPIAVVDRLTAPTAPHREFCITAVASAEG